MKELQKELKEMYKEIEKLKIESEDWKEKASKIEDKELRFDLYIRHQDIDREIRNIKIDMIEKIKELIEF